MALSAVRGSVYNLYTTEDVLHMVEGDVDEPICENSDDDLGMDLEDSDDETRYILHNDRQKLHCLYKCYRDSYK